MPQSYRYRVFFTDGTPYREVTARTDDGARRTAVYAERVTGNKNRKLRVRSVHRLFAAGYRARAELFQPEEVSTEHPGCSVDRQEASADERAASERVPGDGDLVRRPRAVALPAGVVRPTALRAA